MTKDTHTKARADFSVDKDVEREFTLLAKKLAYNKSALIEKYMRQWIEKNKDREEE